MEEVDKNKRMGSDRGRGSRRQEQEAREEWRGPGRGGKPWKGGGDQGRMMRHMGVGEGYGKGGEDQGRGK